MAATHLDPIPDWWNDVRVRNTAECPECGNTRPLTKTHRLCKVCTARHKKEAR